MAVKLRLKRRGAKKAPFYRIVAADSRFPRDGRSIETIGYYNPTTNPATVKVDAELAMKWLKNGAQPSDTVRNILSKEGLMKRFHEEKNANNHDRLRKSFIGSCKTDGRRQDERFR